MKPQPSSITRETLAHTREANALAQIAIVGTAGCKAMSSMRWLHAYIGRLVGEKRRPHRQVMDDLA